MRQITNGAFSAFSPSSAGTIPTGVTICWHSPEWDNNASKPLELRGINSFAKHHPVVLPDATAFMVWTAEPQRSNPYIVQHIKVTRKLMVVYFNILGWRQHSSGAIFHVLGGSWVWESLLSNEFSSSICELSAVGPASTVLDRVSVAEVHTSVLGHDAL